MIQPKTETPTGKKESTLSKHNKNTTTSSSSFRYPLYVDFDEEIEIGGKRIKRFQPAEAAGEGCLYDMAHQFMVPCQGQENVPLGKRRLEPMVPRGKALIKPLDKQGVPRGVALNSWYEIEEDGRVHSNL